MEEKNSEYASKLSEASEIANNEKKMIEDELASVSALKDSLELQFEELKERVSKEKEELSVEQRAMELEIRNLRLTRFGPLRRTGCGTYTPEKPDSNPTLQTKLVPDPAKTDLDPEKTDLDPTKN